jgi:hypothetical protein
MSGSAQYRGYDGKRRSREDDADTEAGMTNETRHLLGWLALPAAAVANGVLRDVTYGRSMSRTAAHSLAVGPLAGLILAWAALLQRLWPLPGRGPALRVGASWLAFTLAFEFGMGAVRGVPVRDMLAEYDVRRGNLWLLVPVVVAAAPLLVCLRSRAGVSPRHPEAGVAAQDVQLAPAE